MKVEDWLGADNQLGIDIWTKKYRHGEESFDEWLDRVSGGDAEVRQLIVEKKFLFGGRILANRGLNKEGVKVTYSNCFSGDTEIRTRQGIVKMIDVVDADIEVFSYGAWRPATVRCFGEQKLSTLKVKKLKSTISYSVTPNHIWYAKKKSDEKFAEYTTEELEPGMILREDYNKAYRTYKPSPFGVAHGLFYGDGDHTGVCRRMNFCGDKAELIPYFMPDTVGNSGDVLTVCSIPKIFWGKPSLDETPSYLYGWLSGYFAADGSVDTRGNCTICSAKKSDLEFVQDVLCVLGMPIYEIREQVRESNLTREVSSVYILSLNRKYLNENFFVLSKHKERFMNKSDTGREDHWQVESVVESDKKELVYCVVEDERHSFTLKNGILTHNCYVLAPPEDSIESIFETASKMARTFSYGGGVGVDLSQLAPRGAKINNTAEETSGAVSFTDLYSMVTGLIGQHGRRGALMLSMSCDHPDVEEFMRVKTDLERVTKANMSIRMTDEFMRCVLNNETFTQTFTRPETGDTVTKTINAREFFKELCDANYDYGEPGCLFWDSIEDWNILSAYDDFHYAGTNPCAEEPLPAGGSCLLGSLNLAAFVREDGEFDYGEFILAVHIAVRALNDVLDEGQPLHPLEEQRKSVKNWRQIGLGIMGLADALIKMELPYGSNVASIECGIIAERMIMAALEESCELAKTHGSFPVCNPEKICKSDFIQNACSNDNSLYYSIMKNGLRNSQLLSIAPTGTISTMLGISGGIEPIFSKSYTRVTKSLDGGEKSYKVYTPIVKEYMDAHGITDESKLPEWFVTAQDISYKDRVDMQAAWQKYIDASISSTVNLPEDFPKEKVYSIYVYAWQRGCKGITVFRDGCKRDSILTTKDTKERGVVETVGNDVIGKKRKLMTGCGSLHCSAFFDPVSGKLKEVFLNKGSTGGCNNYMIGLSRMMSLAARSGCELDDIVGQLRSCGSCPSYAVRRATKHDTSEGSCCPMAVANALIEMRDEMQGRSTIKSDVINPCPKCGAELEFQGGCNVCKSCGWTKCD